MGPSDNTKSNSPDRRWESAVIADLPRRAVALAAEHAPQPFLDAALALIQAELQLPFVVVARPVRGLWESLAEKGTPSALPWEILSEVADGGRAIDKSPWQVVALKYAEGESEVLAIRRDPNRTAVSLGSLESLAGFLASLLSTVRVRHRLQRRVAQQEAILRVAGAWNQTLDLTDLLALMAEASTRLLQSERASIFLWDRPTKTLVARPALGVKGGELRVPDDRGVVGEVVRSGITRIVDSTAADEIDRTVDKQLRHHTRNLLCAPLKSASGKILGAFEMINKRNGEFDADDVLSIEELAHHAAIALENSQQHRQLLRARNQWADQAADKVRLIGSCPTIQVVRNTIERVGPTELSVLVFGENGTGKEVVAQLVHTTSPRRHQPFVAINCAALPESLLESELFGHEKGAFTDARELHQGKFEMASGGTLFLDEIGDMSLSGQAKLLRVLEDKTVFRVGGQQPIHVDTRLIAATNQNLAELVRQKKFREDLYYRLHVVAIELPPLRERGDDILELARHFLDQFSVTARRQPPTIPAESARRLLAHRWPGNVRELRNMMERITFLVQGDELQPSDVTFYALPRAADSGHDESLWSLPLAEATRSFQIDYIQRQILSTGGRMTLAAEKMGLQRANLYRKMKQLGLPTDGQEQ